MEYEKCLVELNEVLYHLPTGELSKIPHEIIENIKRKMDKNYVWKYDTSKELKEQNLNRKTIILLSYLNMEFLFNKEQKELMNEFHECNEEKVEKDKKNKYKTDNLFKNNTINTNYVDNKINNTMLIKVEEEKWYQKIFKFIKKLIRK